MTTTTDSDYPLGPGEHIVRHPNGHLMVERVPLHSEEAEAKALASLAKAYPVLAKHANWIDGEFDGALHDVRRMLASYRARLVAAERERDEWHRRWEFAYISSAPEKTTAAASPAQEATPPREEQHQGWTKNDQRQEPTLSQDAKVWPAEFTTDEKELLQLGIVHALVHHQDQRKQFAKDAADPRFKRHRAGCLRVASHHQEEIYKLGELAAKIGMRNGWPRPEA